MKENQFVFVTNLSSFGYYAKFKATMQTTTKIDIQSWTSVIGRVKHSY
jgi:hypothetical protein